jgi:iron complex outermembrane receptor protein
MKKIVLTLICIISFFAMNAQTKVKGTIKDTAGERILGASIIIKGTSFGGSSDFDGNFSFTTSITGTQTLQVSYIGYSIF